MHAVISSLCCANLQDPSRSFEPVCSLRLEGQKNLVDVTVKVTGRATRAWSQHTSSKFGIETAPLTPCSFDLMKPQELEQSWLQPSFVQDPQLVPEKVGGKAAPIRPGNHSMQGAKHSASSARCPFHAAH
jgi:hypothetical protein